MATPATQTKTAAPPFNPNRSPKQRFQENSKWVGEHRVMVDSEPFARACDFAMLQYQGQVTNQIEDGQGAGAAGLKLQGALEFLAALRNLSETPQIPVRRPDDNLKQ